jgi:hypothetical protein
MSGQRPDDVVTGVLDRMESHARTRKLAILGAGMAEGLLLMIAILTIDWENRTQVLLLIFAVLGYTIIVLGLIALGAHVSRVGARVVAALDEQRTPG